jgi:hypothetical protein
MRAEPAAIRCGEAIEQVGHWVIRTMRGDEVVAGKRCLPIALAARHKDGLALFIGETIERLLVRRSRLRTLGSAITSAASRFTPGASRIRARTWIPEGNDESAETPI